jgi:hypothetical protein
MVGVLPQYHHADGFEGRVPKSIEHISTGREYRVSLFLSQQEFFEFNGLLSLKLITHDA